MRGRKRLPWKKLVAAVALVVVSCSAVAPGVVAEPYGLASQDRRCMASAIWHESRGESVAGQKAVQEVILNRSYAYGKTICEVVKQRAQFSFVSSKTRWLSKSEASEVLSAVSNRSPTVGSCALYFHSVKILPAWTHKFVRIRRVGNHVFYKERNCVDSGR